MIEETTTTEPTTQAETGDEARGWGKLIELPRLEMSGPWPQLTDDQKTELRTAAPQLVAASRGASAHASALEKIRPDGIWQGAVLSAVNSLAAIAGGIALLGATLAWLACGDGETAPNRKGE